jgi:hypothetical protein
VEKFRHIARDTLEVSTSELVLLAELLLRGPQTAGELRSRATRMHPMESIEAVESVLQHLMQREEPMVQKLAPAPGSRAPRHAQLLCPKLHPLHPPEARTAPSAAPTAEAGDLAARVQRLESDVEALRAAVRALAEALGSDDPFAEGSSGS